MRSMLQAFACIGVSALLLAGCGTNHNAGNNNGVNAKNANRANVINQGNRLKQNAADQFNNLTGANNRNTGRNNTSSNAASNTASHTLQLGNWLRIVGTDGRTGTNLNAASNGASNGRNGNRGRGIDSFGEQNPDHVVLLTVNDPKAIQAIDRINQVLSNKTTLRSKSDTLIKDLSYVLQSAQKSSNASGTVQGMSAGRHGRH